jgi:hypothetical protein
MKQKLSLYPKQIWQKAGGRRQKAAGFYVYYWYVVVWAVKFVLTFMATAILLFANREARESGSPLA